MMKTLAFGSTRILTVVRSIRSIQSYSKSNESSGLLRPYYWKQEWRNDKELSKYLMDNIVYRDDYMVAFNKPNGISMFKTSYEQSDISPSNPMDFLSINNCETYLKKELGVNELYGVLSQNRLHSGIIAYCFNKQLSQSISHYFKNAKINKKCVTSHDLICLGHMKKNSGSRTICIGKVLQDNKEVFLEDESFKIGRNKTTTSLMDFNVLKKSKIAFNCSASHIQVHTSCTKWSGLELYALSLMTPVLGDHRYSSRLKLILDKPIIIGPEKAIQEPQDVPVDICKLLNVGVDETEDIPLHIHCSKVIMPKIFKTKQGPKFSRECFQNVIKKESIEENSSMNLNSLYSTGTFIEAPLLPFFTETLRRLQLS